MDGVYVKYRFEHRNVTPHEFLFFAGADHITNGDMIRLDHEILDFCLEQFGRAVTERWSRGRFSANTRMMYVFRDEADAVLFKLRWC